MKHRPETFPQNRTSAQYVAPKSNAGERALVSLAHAPDDKKALYAMVQLHGTKQVLAWLTQMPLVTPVSGQ